MVIRLFGRPSPDAVERTEGSLAFGRGLKGRNRTIADLTRANSLFVSTAAQNDHELLSKMVEFFRRIESDTAIPIPGGAVPIMLKEGEIDGRVIRFLEKIGTGVIDFRRMEKELPSNIEMLRQEFFALVQRHTKDSFDIPPQRGDIAIELAHRGHQGEAIFFDLNRESAGTRRLLILLGRAFRALDAGTPLVIDELDASLHTQACEAVLALFSYRATNPKGAQLIATTHDTNLLRSPLLRRDQIWFTEKDAEGATHLYPLTDIRTRKGDNIEKGYIQGRYGAIPFSSRISDLVTAA